MRLQIGLLPKFLVPLSLLVVATSVAFSTTFLSFMSGRLVRDLEGRGDYLVRSLARTGKYGVFTSFPEILDPIAGGAFAAGDVLFVEIVDLDGTPLVTKVAPGVKMPPLKPMDGSMVRKLSTQAPTVELLDLTRPPRYEFSFPVILEKPALTGEDIVLGGDPSRPRPPTFQRIGAVRVGLSLATLRQELAGLKRRVIALTALIVVAALSVTAVLARGIISPVSRLAEGARRISEGDFSFRTPIRSSDEIGLLSRAFNDMAERVEGFQQGLERKVAERTDALLRKTRDMEEFVYTVSHDLKAPVVSTHGLVSLLAEEFGPSLPPDAKVYVDRIQANATHMERLILDLFEMSRIDRPGKTLETVATSALVSDVLLEHEGELRKAGIQVTVQPPMPEVWAIKDQLTQVFDNLVGNAIKFRKPGVTGHIEIGGSVEADRAVLFVGDDGIGIDPRHHEKIFGLFQRLHTEREYPGTGLGLAIVKKVIERHGGGIEVTSAVGTGARFTFWLPRPREEAAAR
ncbi:MAG: HAMP domain-containing sensor histidine kinase [Acidobacteriota bacterium]